MLRMTRNFRRFNAGIASLAVFCLLCASASAQLSLPKSKKSPKDSAPSKTSPKDGPSKPKPGSRGVVPHLVCSTCGEHNYLAGFDRPEPDGTFWAHCAYCRRDMKHRRSKEVLEEGRLKLPGGQKYPLPVGGDARRSGASPEVRQGSARYGDGAAGFIVRQVANSEKLDASVIEKGVESMLGLGEEGLISARIVLHDDVASVVLMAGRVLIRGGQPADAERVVARLRTQTPGKSGAILLDDLLRRDPVNGSPQLLIELLDHKQKPMRTAAMRHLRGSATAEYLPMLKATLSSKRTDTRVFALELIEDIDDPEVIDVLFEHLDDKSSRVAGRVIEALAVSIEDRVDLELLSRALNGKWILRDNAYAILAIIEREDDQLKPIFDDRHADALLAGLRANDLLVRGACAAALAGIGFRSARPLQTTWLDREVTGTMVMAVSGKAFHSDFTAMQPRVLQRLRLISGVDFGTDGPRWTQWWVDNRVDFYANRAYLEVAEGGESRIELHFRGTGRATGTYSLLGSEALTREAVKRAGTSEKVFMTRRECRDLISLMQREGILGPERQPGVRGSMGPGQREIEVVVDGRGKSFLFGNGRTEPWFEKMVSAMDDLRDRNHWQRFPNRARYPDQLDFWAEESGWWAGEHDARERGLRMKSLIFSSIKQLPPSERTLALRELMEEYEVEGVAQEEDFLFLLDLLRDEGFYAERAELLIDLAELSVLVGTEPGVPGSIDREHAAQLIDLLLARFDRNSIGAMGGIARACGREFVRELARDERPILRAVAAGELSRDTSEEDAALLMTMLEDPEILVEGAAVVALGEAGVEEARTELLLRARLGSSLVRAAALQSIGRLGGEYVLEALVLGVSDPHPEVKRGAAQGLAILRDPQSAPLLISLLRQGPDSEIFVTARAGLIDLGDSASSDLLRVVNSPAHKARRECALLLSEMGNPRVVPALISMVSDDPEDRQLAFELAVLTCYDARDSEDPGERWTTWYGEVTHDDSLSWLLAAMERRGIPISVAASFRGSGPGTREGALLMLEVLSGEEDFLIERARRELSRMLGGDLGELPRSEADQGVWLEALRDTILERFES
jgi:HEAT repeat protein